MSAPTSMAPSQVNDTSSKASRSLEADIATLTQLLSGTGSQGTGEWEGEDVAELLRRLEAAEDLADGMEERLDGIMDSLDDLLGDLEARVAGGAEAETMRGGENTECAAVAIEEEITVVAATESHRGASEEK